MDYARTNWFLNSSPCLVVLARYEIDAPITNAPTNTAASSSLASTQTTQQKKEKHFFLLMQFQSPNKKFGVENTEPLNPISTLTRTLFPDQSNQQIFVFDSKNLNHYIEKINTIPNNETLKNWWLAQQSYFAVGYNWSKEAPSDADVKRKLIESINSFNTKINDLTNMDFVTDPMNPVLSIAKTIVTDTDSNTLKQKHDDIEQSLNKSFFTGITAKSSIDLRAKIDNNTNISPQLKAEIKNNLAPDLFQKLSADETAQLQELMKRITTAHISYVADLSSDRLIDALPRALYREVEILCKNLHVSAPGFKPRILKAQFWKRSLINTAAAAGIGLLFTNLATNLMTKYNWGIK